MKRMVEQRNAETTVRWVMFHKIKRARKIKKTKKRGKRDIDERKRKIDR